jgi:hypothetical protein
MNGEKNLARVTRSTLICHAHAKISARWRDGRQYCRRSIDGGMRPAGRVVAPRAGLTLEITAGQRNIRAVAQPTTAGCRPPPLSQRCRVLLRFAA